MDKPSTWYWAEEICSSIDGHLVSIHDAFTNIFLSQIVNSTRNIWIGGTTNVLNATWSWSDNSSWSGYTNWNNKIVNSSFGHCTIAKSTNFMWESVDCSISNASSICEFEDKASPTPTGAPKRRCFLNSQQDPSETDDLQYWIGLNDPYEDDNYKWLDGTPFDFTYWHYGRPSRRKQCGYMHTKDSETSVFYPNRPYVWDTYDCNTEMTNGFICETLAFT
uniref:C-type lectin domain-containing protein n=1 Tax=Acrobeloides nanus TaxID=290746 RepID=A0A914D531_9BILA